MTRKPKKHPGPGRPPKRPAGTWAPITISISNKARSALRDLANKNGTSMGEVVNDLVLKAAEKVAEK